MGEKFFRKMKIGWERNGYLNSRGLRGSSLEEMINYTNEYYREKKLAVVQKNTDADKTN